MSFKPGDHTEVLRDLWVCGWKTNPGGYIGKGSKVLITRFMGEDSDGPAYMVDISHLKVFLRTTKLSEIVISGSDLRRVSPLELLAEAGK